MSILKKVNKAILIPALNILIRRVRYNVFHLGALNENKSLSMDWNSITH